MVIIVLLTSANLTLDFPWKIPLTKKNQNKITRLFQNRELHIISSYCYAYQGFLFCLFFLLITPDCQE